MKMVGVPETPISILPSAHILFRRGGESLSDWQVALEAIHVETQRTNEFDGFLPGRRRIAVVNPVMHVPEPALLRRGLRRPRHEARTGMRLLVRKMPNT